VATVAVQRNGAPAANYEYELEGTPCSNVLRSQAICSYTRDVWKQFPRDKGVESYVGAPLVDSSNAPMGLLAVLFRRPLAQVAHIESLLRIFASRAAAELERRQQLKALEHLAHHDTLTRLANRRRLRDGVASLGTGSITRQREADAILAADLRPAEEKDG
jgi:hypothetical protein